MLYIQMKEPSDIEVIQSRTEKLLTPYFSTTEVNEDKRTFTVKKPLSYPDDDPLEIAGETFEINNDSDFESAVTKLFEELGLMNIKQRGRLIIGTY